MPFITQGFGSDQRVQLGADEIIRPMQWGTNWSKIRIGMRMAINSGQTISNAAFVVGVCQGSIGFTATNTTDAIGTSPGNIFTNIYNTSWTYFSAFGGITLGGTSGICCGRKVGANYVTTSAVNSANIYCAAQPLMGATRSIYLVDIAKGTNTVSVTNWSMDLASVAQDCSRFWLLYQMENETAPKTPGLGGLTSNGAATLSVTGSAFAWDNVFLSWSRSIPVLELCDVTVVRYY